MHAPYWTPAAAGDTLRRLYVFNGGFLTQRRVRRILELAGYDISLGKPSEDDLIGVWGASPTSPRGEAVSARTKTPIIRVEDAFVRSVKTGRDGDAPIGLLIDDMGLHFDPSRVSRLEHILRDEPLDDTALLNRARHGIERMKRGHISKYNAFDPALPAPDPGYVLVIDQTKGDASVTASKADRNRFREMLFIAREEHPHARIIVKSHPETVQGHREGHLRPEDCDDNTTFWTDPVSPWALMDGAIAVYTVSSQLGFEAIMAGHKPHVFGQPFYMGWGLTDDRVPLARRQRNLTRAQLFAAAMILYPTWYDPYRDRLATFEEALAAIEAEARCWREDHAGWSAQGMRLWKRGPLQKAFGLHRAVRFRPTEDRPLMVWAGKAGEQDGITRVEDGFIRSRGLGAELTPPLSLVLDDLGIYYDPTRPSRLEALINASDTLPEYAERRAEALVRKIVKAGLTKYNLSGDALPSGLPTGRRILVPGQVEDDASIRLGADDIKSNRALLEAVRKANPAAVVLYKPHPDVEAGLRTGKIDASDLADAVLTNVDAMAALNAVDEVWTMTSTVGFEALLRGKRVVTYGRPFYAGWGLTTDRGMPMPDRVATPSLAAFAHACLIDYPRYFDPATGRPCPPEVIVDMLASGATPSSPPLLSILSKVQGIFASFAPLWR